MFVARHQLSPSTFLPHPSGGIVLILHLTIVVEYASTTRESMEKNTDSIHKESPGEGAPAVDSPRYSIVDSPRPSVVDSHRSSDEDRRPGDSTSNRLHVTNEVTLPAPSKETKQTALSPLPIRPHDSTESFSPPEPTSSSTTLGYRKLDPSWPQFLAGEKRAGEDASSYYPDWSVSALGALFSPCRT